MRHPFSFSLSFRFLMQCLLALGLSLGAAVHALAGTPPSSGCAHHGHGCVAASAQTLDMQAAPAADPPAAMAQRADPQSRHAHACPDKVCHCHCHCPCVLLQQVAQHSPGLFSHVLRPGARAGAMGAARPPEIRPPIA